tara:strand:+ start:209 stop:595 length:387 start_codon:yes stop_codon:yes gene_type:complete
MTLTTQKLAGNIAARSLSEQARDLIVELWQESDVPDECDRQFWMKLHGLIAELAQIEPPTPVIVGRQAMTDDESRRFGRTLIPFGVHAGVPVDDVPLGYLLWLESQPDFRISLSRYLASPRMQQEQPE